ncbi:MAG: DUF1501 domain-containing protein [Planctomycetaceae bacterium]
MSIRRRDFLKFSTATGGLVCLGGTVPSILGEAAASAAGNGGPVLVVIQMSGGNDGLNTVSPVRHDTYRKLRPQLALDPQATIPINDELSLHPALKGFAGLLEQQKLAIVQGVGYADPNRSHFESMDIWHTCQRKTQQRSEGWLGRYLSHQLAAKHSGASAFHLGAEKQPLALACRDVAVPTIRELKQFKLQVSNGDVLASLRRESATQMQQPGLLDFVQSAQKSALDVSEQLAAQSGKQTSVSYPDSPLAEKLSTVAQLIRSGLPASVYYVQHDGFDTHANQAAAHEGLLRQLGDSVSTFTKDLESDKLLERVCVMCFSEFGRRVAENASEGTDHGTAAPMFLIGNNVQAGLHGEHPSLDDLDAGDLRFHTDFRRVYAAVLKDWLKVPTTDILGAEYAPVPLFA